MSIQTVVLPQQVLRCKVGPSQVLRCKTVVTASK